MSFGFSTRFYDHCLLDRFNVLPRPRQARFTQPFFLPQLPSTRHLRLSLLLNYSCHKKNIHHIYNQSSSHRRSHAEHGCSILLLLDRILVTLYFELASWPTSTTWPRYRWTVAIYTRYRTTTSRTIADDVIIDNRFVILNCFYNSF